MAKSIIFFYTTPIKLHISMPGLLKHCQGKGKKYARCNYLTPAERGDEYRRRNRIRALRNRLSPTGRLLRMRRRNRMNRIRDYGNMPQGPARIRKYGDFDPEFYDAY